MASKKYPPVRDESNAKEPVVKEAKAEPYRREKGQKNGGQVALSIATVKRRLKKPVKRKGRDIAWALGIAGIGEGPEDLSENTRRYLYSKK